MIAAQFGLRTIPTAPSVQNGQPVDGFQAAAGRGNPRSAG